MIFRNWLIQILKAALDCIQIYRLDVNMRDISVTANPVLTPHQHAIDVCVYTPSQVPSIVFRTIRDPAKPRLFPVVDDPGDIMEKPSTQTPDQSTFNITGVFDVPGENIERSIQDPDSVMTIVAHRKTTYTIIEGATQRGKRK